MESIVHDVASRVLQEASIEAVTAALALGAAAGGGKVNSCTERNQRRPSEPLPLDLKSTPWAIWREAQGSPRGQRRDKVCSLSGETRIAVLLRRAQRLQPPWKVWMPAADRSRRRSRNRSLRAGGRAGHMRSTPVSIPSTLFRHPRLALGH
ncbi:unnamed protein product [Polarella glacialis]|uniref:Uncharacterized protein n=1 Tax=Polarella glacialis TaxID=89957 RepID=A0A813DN30_POLGL|nr:unnamed protein product [Polarella glacialis]